MIDPEKLMETDKSGIRFSREAAEKLIRDVNQIGETCGSVLEKFGSNISVSFSRISGNDLESVPEMTGKLETQDAEILIAAKTAMLPIAKRVGNMHSYWDIIFDIEAALKNEKTISSKEDLLFTCKQVLRKL